MKRIFILTGLIWLLSCEKNDVPTADVIYDMSFTTRVVEANGSSSVTLSVKLNKDADSDKRKVVFSATGGTFEGAAGRTITQAAEFVNGELIAKATWKSSRSPSLVVFSAKPEAVSMYRDFIVKDSFITSRSVASKIVASASAFSVPADYVGEIKISGAVKNADGKDASTGYKVLFEDFFAGGQRAQGKFREMVSVNDDSPFVSALYSPGAVTPGMPMYVRISLLDANNQPTGIRDSVFFNVIKI